VRTIVKGKNIEVPDRVRTYAERKLRRLDRILDDRSDAIVELSNEQHRSAADAHIAEVTLVIDGQALRSHAAGATYQAAIDTVVDKVERQAVDYKEKPRSVRVAQRQAASRPVGTAIESTPEPRIVKTKRFGIEPMFEEDALAEMAELGHSFFLFVNAETERLAVIYRRDDGDYGLIEPILGGAYAPDGPAGSARPPRDRRARAG